ncbi:MAG: hypothetical protein HUU21_36065 [Polyangiaceae bacterium]|nr:hypothetical protein [Polyangiaceae bacterium]NUQ78972.1 hypothetical protein [Polyangiaceae bacterium]
MMCCVITRYHVMAGVDRHTSWVQQPIPPWLPIGPHFVGAMCQFGPWWMAKPNRSTTIDTVIGAPMSRGFEIGMFIPHLGVNSIFLLAIYLLTSSSQAHFGVSSVLIEVDGSGSGPVAVALFLFANPQLNCDDFSFYPGPLPTGLLLAPNTIVAGLTIGDLIAGIYSMILSSLATALIGFVTGKIGPGLRWMGGKLSPFVKAGAGKVIRGTDRLVSGMIVRFSTKRLGPFFAYKMFTGVVGEAGGALSRVLGAFARSPIGKATDKEAMKILETLLGFAIGSPAGYGMPGAPLGSLPIQQVASYIGVGADRMAGEWGLNEYFNDGALIPTFPFVMPESAAEAVITPMQGPLGAVKPSLDEAAKNMEPTVQQQTEPLRNTQSPIPLTSDAVNAVLSDLLFGDDK